MSCVPGLSVGANLITRPGHFYLETQLDVREGGENPPLPRNCKRFAARLVYRRIPRVSGMSVHQDPA